MKIDIHNYGHQLKKGIERLKKDKKANKNNKDFILAFVDPPDNYFNYAVWVTRL